MDYHIAGRPITLGGRKVLVGQPVPESCCTWTLTELGWIVRVTKAEFDTAVRKYGRPPETVFVGWNYIQNGKPRRRTKTTAKSRKKAKRRKARAR